MSTQRFLNVKGVNAIVFDLDGTLYDNRPLLLLMPLLNIRHLKLVLAERTARKEIAGKWLEERGNVYKALFGIMHSRTGICQEKIEQWFQCSYMPSQITAIRGICRKRKWVDTILEDLKSRGLKVVCFSDYGFAEEKLKALGIDPDAFDLIMDAASAGGLKPCRESFLSISDMIGVPPQQMLVVGDRDDTDGAGAYASGMHFLKMTGKLNSTADSII